MGRRKINPKVKFDWDELMRFVRRLRKVRPKTKVTDEMMNHPSQAIRWWAINGKNVKRYEQLYFKDKSHFVRSKIVEKTKNVEILSHAASYDKRANIKEVARKRLSHLMQKR